MSLNVHSPEMQPVLPSGGEHGGQSVTNDPQTQRLGDFDDTEWDVIGSSDAVESSEEERLSGASSHIQETHTTSDVHGKTEMPQVGSQQGITTGSEPQKTGKSEGAVPAWCRGLLQGISRTLGQLSQEIVGKFSPFGVRASRTLLESKKQENQRLEAEYDKLESRMNELTEAIGILEKGSGPSKKSEKLREEWEAGNPKLEELGQRIALNAASIAQYERVEKYFVGSHAACVLGVGIFGKQR